MEIRVPVRLVRKAERQAQRRLRNVLVERTYNDPNAHNVILYQQAERRLRSLRGDPEPRWAWEVADELAYVMGGKYADEAHLLPDVPLARTPDAGDVFVYPDAA